MCKRVLDFFEVAKQPVSAVLVMFRVDIDYANEWNSEPGERSSGSQGKTSDIIQHAGRDVTNRRSLMLPHRDSAADIAVPIR